MGESLVIDPISENAANAPVEISDGKIFALMSHSYPTPPRSVNWASGADTEGEDAASLRYQNRTITIEVRIYGKSAADLEAQQGKLKQKDGKINGPENGTLKRTTPSGKTIVFDLVESSVDFTTDTDSLVNFRSKATITFIAKPFGRGPEEERILHTETVFPVLTFTEAAPGGDVPALGRLEVENASTHDQLSWIWGEQCRYFDSATSAELLLQAEKLTMLNGTFVRTVSGATPNGANNGVLQENLFPAFLPMFSTTIAATGRDQSQVGSFRVFARFLRPATNTGAVSVALEWAQGDFRQRTLNDSWTWGANELEGEWVTVDLGLISINPVTAGEQRWEGRLLAQSSVVGDDLYCDCLYLFPIDEGYGELDVVNRPEKPTSVVAHDEFNQTEGNLEGKTMPTTQTWAEVNKTGASGFQVSAVSPGVKRIAVSDTSLASGCFATVGTTNFTTISQSATVLQGTAMLGGTSRIGLLARYVSTTKWLIAVIDYTGTSIFNEGIRIRVIKDVGSGEVIIGESTLLEGNTWVNRGHGFKDISELASAKTLNLSVDTAGNWQLICDTVNLAGTDADLATGGTLASGRCGLYDAYTSATAGTRYLDNYVLSTSTAKPDAAVYAEQSAQVRWDRVQREDSEGKVLVDRRDYKGNYLRVPADQGEGRTIRIITKLARGPIGSSGEGAGLPDPLAGRLYLTPRYLVVPEP